MIATGAGTAGQKLESVDPLPDEHLEAVDGARAARARAPSHQRRLGVPSPR